MGICSGNRTRDLFQFHEINCIKLKNGEEYAFRQLNPLPGEDTHKDNVVLFLHATYFSGLMLNTGGLLQSLASSSPEYRYIALDFRGNGNSSYKNKIKSLYDLADDVKEFIDALGLGKVILVGTCLGGLVAQLVAIRHPEYLNGIVLIGSMGPSGGAHLFEHETKFPVSYEEVGHSPSFQSFDKLIKTGDFEAIKKVMDTYQPKTMLNSENVDLAIRETLLSKNVHEVVWAEISINIGKKHNGHFDGTNELQKIKCPALIVHGEADRMIHWKEAVAIHEELGKDNTELVLLKNVGHFTWYDNLEQTCFPIQKFLQKHKAHQK